MATDTRYREQHRFWLDLRKEHDDTLSDAIFQLKEARMFAKTIRDGLRLIIDLRQKRLDVLFELFPWVEVEIDKRAAIDNGDLHRRIDYLEHKLFELERDRGASGYTMQPAGPRPLGAPQLAKPQYDDDADDVAALKASARKDTSTDSAANFLKSMMNLQAGFDKQQ